MAMETWQYSGCCSATKFGGWASPPHVEMKGESCRIRSLLSTGDRGSGGGAGFTAFNRKSLEGRVVRKSFKLRETRAALAVDEDKQQRDVARLDERSVDMPVPHDVQRTKSKGSTGSNKIAVATDYIQYLPELLRDDSGPPRWFCPMLENKPPEQAPVLLFLPEVVGTGLGFSLQQENLARLFELRCLQIPVMDRTPFEGLVSFVEETVRKEAKLNPGRPIYLLGESFGGTLALALASRNPKLDLVLVLVNPATSFDESPLQPLIPLIQALPPALFPAVPVLLGLVTYDPVQWASQIATKIAPSFGSGQMSPDSITGVLRSLLDVVDALPKSILPWKLKMLESSARYANSRIRAVKADVLILASEKDQLLPSLEEAKRLRKILPTSTYRKFPQSGHMLLVEEGFNLASWIKATGFYRRTRSKDVVSNFVRPTKEEIDMAYGTTDILRKLTSPVFFSTGDDGEVVRGVSKIPTSKQPLIFVGNHFFYGLDMGMLWGELLNKLDVLPRGLAHPILFDQTLLEENSESIEGDRARLFGGVPVGGKNMFKLLSRGDSVALYPGGAREALHRKNEWHKLFWPERPEVIRMAARFGATFIPMCTVGEDEIYEILLDYNDLINLPLVGGQIYDTFDRLPKWREDLDGEVGNQMLHIPLAVPKLGGPGRIYILFGKPIYTEGKEDFFRDPKNVEAEYKQLRAAVEGGLAYLVNKRKEDAYREFFPRIAYEIAAGGKQAPTFEP